MSVFIWMLAGLIISALLTGVLRRYALGKQLLDIPNARSSHTAPTPRGGGVAIVVSYLALLLLLHVLGVVALRPLLALFGAGLAAALLGFLDDHGHVPARWRLLGHFVAAGWGLYWLSGLPVEVLPGLYPASPWLINGLAIFYLVWMLNLYNFMDGIDGIAGIEAVTTTVSAGLLFYLAGNQQGVVLSLLLASAAAGFLLWNFPPARIFMGDAGSGFLGLELALLSIYAAARSPVLFWAWLILLGVFIVDATLTLIVRLARRERVYEAHRSHAYQFASRHYGRHLPVTLAVLAINMLWLLPWAWSVAAGRVPPLIGLTLAWLPLLVLALRFRAGRAEVQASGS